MKRVGAWLDCVLFSALIAIYRLSHALYIRGRIFQMKSKFYQWIFEGGFEGYTVATYTSIYELARVTQRFVYERDSWRQLWDAASRPEKVECALDSEIPGKALGGDCEDLAIYIAIALRKSIGQGLLEENVAQPRLLIVGWVSSTDWAANGHGVCLMTFPGEDLPFGEMDYGHPRRYATLSQLVTGVVARCGGTGAICLGWSISDPATLAPLEVHFRLD